ncbi:MAG TPA: radical SAM protein, partial [Phycisphaerae bacterium]|nr:radical SAM protein [Phycisphaerae bacterium]
MSDRSDLHRVRLDPEGRLVFPDPVRRRWGLEAGADVVVRQTPQGLMLFPADPPLGKVYVEPTSACNLSCRTCMRHSWNEPVGTMTGATFQRLLASLATVPSFHTMAFWGMGEPLLHPEIASMVQAAKDLGAETELITNGLLLSPELARALVAAGLDRLVVSVDGVTPRRHAENRTGADLETIKANVLALRRLRHEMQRMQPEIGIEFVLMRRNLDEVRNLRGLASELGASFIVLTNVLPYTKEVSNEILYWISADRPWADGRSIWFPKISVPRFDARRENLEPLASLIWPAGGTAEPIQRADRFPDNDGHCRFVEQGSMAVGWDGAVSPCIALMHSYTCFVLDREKRIRRYVLGNVGEEDVRGIWEKEEYRRFRKRVLDFDFPPCIHCGGCDFVDGNEQDCYSSTFPSCGDCLWA